MPFDWNKFKDGERFKFVKAGDNIEGKILNITTTTFGGSADPTPVLTLQTDRGVVTEVTASQSVLCSRLAEAGPDVGDTIYITYDGDADNAKPGRSPAKLFTVVVKRAGEVAAPTTATPPADATAPDPADEPF